MDHNRYASEDADRAIIAIHALLVALSGDPCILRAYASWCDRATKPYSKLPASAPSWLANAELARGMWADYNRDLARIEYVLSRELRLTYQWLAPTLLRIFHAVLTDHASGGGVLDLSFSKYRIDATRQPGETLRAYIKRISAADAPPKGRRRVKGSGAHIARDVDWYYRAEIKQPAESVISLARAYAREVNRTTEARSVVYIGIQRAKDILAGITLY